jgi:hypothetical protein
MNIPFQDLDELAEKTLEGIGDGHFILMIGLQGAEATLSERAQRIGRGALPIDPASIPQL